MLKASVARFFNALEAIGETHEELYDTDVREQLAETLYFAFVWGHRLRSAPVTFGMFSAEGDAMVSSVVSAFLREALQEASVEHIAIGAPRLAALQNASIVTKGGQTYDNFIGHADEPFDPDGLSGQPISRCRI